jgi:AraC-like DNA-binding protein
MYREWGFELDGAVVWTRTASGEPARVVPDGCMDIIWIDGELIVAGPDTRAHLTSAPAGTRYVGVRFRPGQAPAVLGLPADELRDQRPRLDDVWPGPQTRRAAELIAGAPDRPRALAELVRQCLRAAPADPVAQAVWRRLRTGQPVAATADAVGLSERQLRRRCLTAFGYGPKTLARVLRFNRALALARTGEPLGTVAATTGYADQAHLAREFREFAGVPPRQLLA